MAYFDPNSVFRVLSATRAGTLPPPKPTTATPAPSGAPAPSPAPAPSAAPATTTVAAAATPKKSLNMYLTLISASESPIMQAASSDSANQLWFFRPADGQFTGLWTIHCLSKGDGVCLQRVDPTTGAMKMGEFTKGRLFPSQVWWIETAIQGSVSVSSIQNRRDTQPPPDPQFPWPMKLDVKWGEDLAAAFDYVFKGNSATNTATGLPWVEGTKWDIQFARAIAWKTQDGKQVPS